MTPVESIYTQSPIGTPDWGGDKARKQITATEATIGIDFDARIATIKPVRGGRVIVVPFENVSSWQPFPETKPEPKPAPAPTPPPAPTPAPAPVAAQVAPKAPTPAVSAPTPTSPVAPPQKPTAAPAVSATPEPVRPAAPKPQPRASKSTRLPR